MVDLEIGQVMTAEEFLHGVLDPGLAWCATIPGWKIPVSDKARALLTAISGQEANWTERVQMGNGLAHGLFQFERAGGVNGVLGAETTWQLAVAACNHANVTPRSSAVWAALALPTHDNLAVAFARLLLWADPSSLPDIGDEDDAWDCYTRNWRPGKPSRERWSDVYPQAVEVVTGAKS